MTDPSRTAADMMAMHRQQIETQNERAGRYDAENIFEHLMEKVKSFQRRLSEDEEIGLRLANFGEAVYRGTASYTVNRIQEP